MLSVTWPSVAAPSKRSIDTNVGDDDSAIYPRQALT
jgi:hypothetical protein